MMDFAEFRGEIMELVDKATVKFKDSYKSDEKFETFETACEEIYELVQEFDCECMDVDVDEFTKRLTISLECDEIVLQHGREHCFFDLVKRTNSFSFSKDGEFLRVSFDFDGLWE
jgi:hypothetical protein